MVQAACYVVLLLSVFRASGQANLVPNPSFESYTMCPTSSISINNTGTWYNANAATADYFNACVPPAGAFGVPQNFFGGQAAYNGGNGYAGIVAWMGGTIWREYIQTQLSSPLMAGQPYYLSFYVSAAELNGIATDDFGAYLSVAPITMSPSVGNFSVVPQVANLQGQFLTDTVNWIKISGSFIAAGGEQYITIGNFNDNATTSTVVVSTSSNSANSAYYYIDEVCLSSNPFTCDVNIGVGLLSQQTNSRFFYYNPSSHLIVFEEQAGPCTVTISDLLGKHVQAAVLDGNRQLDVSDLPKGCYFVQVSEAWGKSVKKIIVN